MCTGQPSLNQRRISAERLDESPDSSVSMAARTGTELVGSINHCLVGVCRMLANQRVGPPLSMLISSVTNFGAEGGIIQLWCCDVLPGVPSPSLSMAYGPPYVSLCYYVLASSLASQLAKPNRSARQPIKHLGAVRSSPVARF